MTPNDLITSVSLVDVIENIKGRVMLEYLGIATKLSSYAERHLDGEDKEALNYYIPCKAYLTEEKAEIDGSFLVALEGMGSRDGLVHLDMLVIENIKGRE